MILLTLSGIAAAQEYRLVSLSDGRSYRGEVLVTEPAGMRLRVPQGEVLAPFSLLSDMAPIEEAAVTGQEPLGVYLHVANRKQSASLAAAFAHVPHLVVYTNPKQMEIGSDAKATLGACQGDMTCAAGALEGSAWMWLVTVEDGEVVSRVSTGDTTVRAVLSGDPKGQRQSAFEVLMISPETPAAEAVSDAEPDEEVVPTETDTPIETDAPTVVATGDGSEQVEPAGQHSPGRAPVDPWTPEQASRAAFVPLPGYPSLRMGDLRGFALSWAIAVPATASWVAVSGTSSQSAAEHAIIGLAGFYVATVVANQLTARGSLSRQISVAPMATAGSGGASGTGVVVSGSW